MVECTGFENRHTARYQRFKSSHLRYYINIRIILKLGVYFIGMVDMDLVAVYLVTITNLTKKFMDEEVKEKCSKCEHDKHEGMKCPSCECVA